MISNLRISSKSSDFIAISWDIKGRYDTIITCFLLIVFLAIFFKEFRNWFDTSFLFIRFIVFFVKVMIEMFSFLLKYRSTFIFFDIGHNPNFSLSVHLPVRRWTSFTERRLHLSGTPLPQKPPIHLTSCAIWTRRLSTKCMLYLTSMENGELDRKSSQ